MKIFFVFVLFTASVLSQDDSIIKLFPGKWKMDVENEEIFESWISFYDTTLVGMSYSKSNCNFDINEQILLRKTDNNWEYIAIPDNQNITRFLLVEHSSKKFVFENKEHDFPQRIIYEFHKDGKMTAAIEGTVNNEIKRKEFSFTIVED